MNHTSIENVDNMLEISETEEFFLLRSVYTSETVKISKGHLEMGFQLLKYSLILMYGSTDVSALMIEKPTDEFCEKFSKTLDIVIKNNCWCRRSGIAALCSLKKLFNLTNINQAIITKIHIPLPKEEEHPMDMFLPVSHRGQLHAQELAEKCCTFSKYKSISTRRAWLACVIKFLNILKIPIQHYREKINLLTFDEIKIAANKLVHYSDVRKYLILESFICFICERANLMDKFKVERKRITIVPKTCQENDIHRFSAEELSELYNESLNNPKYKAIFVLLSTTGMRTIGLSNIKLKSICTKIGDDIIMNHYATTIEKGKKSFTFTLNKLCQDAIYDWITNHRKSNGSYLFPGKSIDSKIASSRINEIIKLLARKRGIVGQHVHAHSIRHTFAHMLLESGNKIEDVSKMMGHANSKTTEKYYLKETPVEVSKRLNISWLSRDSKKENIPSFLSSDIRSNEKLSIRKKSKKEQQSRARDIISMHKKIQKQSLNSIEEHLQ